MSGMVNRRSLKLSNLRTDRAMCLVRGRHGLRHPGQVLARKGAVLSSQPVMVGTLTGIRCDFTSIDSVRAAVLILYGCEPKGRIGTSCSR